MAQVRTRSRGADTCHDDILPRVRDARQSDDQIIEEHYFREGGSFRTICGHRREPRKQAGYLLKAEPGLSVAVVEVKC